MKLPAIALVLLSLCAVSSWPQSRTRRQPGASDPAPIVDIRQIDFANYTFPLNGRSYKLIDGSYAENNPPNPQWQVGLVDGPYIVDLTGDKKEEAVFVLRYGPIGGPTTSEARVYTLENGQPALVTTFQVTGPINCKLDHYIDIQDGLLSVERVLGNGSQCDHNEITQYRWNGGAFIPIGAVRRMPCRCA